MTEKEFNLTTLNHGDLVKLKNAVAALVSNQSSERNNHSENDTWFILCTQLDLLLKAITNNEVVLNQPTKNKQWQTTVPETTIQEFIDQYEVSPWLQRS